MSILLFFFEHTFYYIVFWSENGWGLGFQGRRVSESQSVRGFPLQTLLLRTSGSGLEWGLQSIPFLSPALSLSPGAQIAPGSAWCCHASARPPPPTLPLPGPVDAASSHAPLPTSAPASVTHSSIPVASRLAPPPPLRWTPPALTWPTGEAPPASQGSLSPPALPLAVQPLTFFWPFIPSFLLPGLLAISPSKLHHLLPEAFP